MATMGAFRIGLILVACSIIVVLISMTRDYASHWLLTCPPPKCPPAPKCLVPVNVSHPMCNGGTALEDFSDGSRGCYSPQFLRRVQTALDQLPWHEWYPRIDLTIADGYYLPPDIMEKYLEVITPFIGTEWRPPSTLYNATDEQPINCAEIPPALKGRATGNLRSPAAKLFDIFPFAYELDVLELRLTELEGVVDYFGLLESTFTHRTAPKQLFYAVNERRYSRWRNQIKHLVGDASDWGRVQYKKGHHWEIESRQKILLLRKFLASFPEGYIQPHDLFIHGDVDEIPDRNIVRYIKQCEVATPLGMISSNWAFTFGFSSLDNWPNPAIFQLSQASNQGNELVPLRGGVALLGAHTGWHLSYFGGPVSNLFKSIALAEV